MKLKVDSNPKERTQIIVAIDLLESLNQAVGGCEQIALTRRDPRFLLMRDGLAAMKQFCIATLPKSVRKGEREKKIIIV